MGQVTVALNGRSYRLSCGDGEETRLLGLAADIRERLDLLAAQFGQLGDERLLVMAVLMITDELWDARLRLAAVQEAAEVQATLSAMSLADAPENSASAMPEPSAPEMAAVREAPRPAAAVPTPQPTSAPATDPPQKRTLRRPVAPQRSTLDERLAEAREASVAADRKVSGG